ncbi:trypsin-like peptidase domain-containing protein [Leptolyngbya sp. FACHB-671]|uniref:trypsin-like serine peptidase n=1 Tax=Leptolyngbya sp. FACHB-671 TaxID=2692812 RepID=UPI001684E754|nr:trypsin-like peptidase domain-containing protein [Leptolyngbya sp. FACHB-671]MBD2069517.1 trypsin-like peptidase domain-containing protein [Leptolyngbya sp. FACHB-671]
MNTKAVFKQFAILFAASTSLTAVSPHLTSSDRSTASARFLTHPDTELAQSMPISDLASFNLSPDIQSFIPAHLDNQPDSPTGGRGVLGTDDRIEVLSQAYPWSTIGRIEGIDVNGESYICTGTLVSGDVVLTNAHCVVDITTQQLSQAIRFMPNLINNQIPDAADVAYVEGVYVGTDFSDRPSHPHPDDWAFLKLDKPFGEKYGWLGWSSLPISTLSSPEYQEQLIFVGYSGDYPNENPGATAGAQFGCSILDEMEEVLLHNCDTFGGSSGGPILGLVDGELKIVAINTAEAVDTESGEIIINLAVPIDRIVAQLN